MTTRKNIAIAVLLLVAGLFFVAGQVSANCGNCKHEAKQASCDKKCDSTCKHDGKSDCKKACDDKCKADCKEHSKCECKDKGECKHADKKDCSGACANGHAQQGNSANCPMHSNLTPTDTTKSKK